MNKLDIAIIGEDSHAVQLAVSLRKFFPRAQIAIIKRKGRSLGLIVEKHHFYLSNTIGEEDIILFPVGVLTTFYRIKVLEAEKVKLSDHGKQTEVHVILGSRDITLTSGTVIVALRPIIEVEIAGNKYSVFSLADLNSIRQHIERLSKLKSEILLQGPCELVLPLACALAEKGLKVQAQADGIEKFFEKDMSQKLEEMLRERGVILSTQEKPDLRYLVYFDNSFLDVDPNTEYLAYGEGANAPDDNTNVISTCLDAQIEKILSVIQGTPLREPPVIRELELSCKDFKAYSVGIRRSEFEKATSTKIHIKSRNMGEIVAKLVASTVDHSLLGAEVLSTMKSLCGPSSLRLLIAQNIRVEDALMLVHRCQLSPLLDPLVLALRTLARKLS